MITTEPTNQGLRKPSENVPVSTQLKESVLNVYSQHETKLNCVESSETGRAYHYCLKLPGYIMDDFTCYRTKTHLVITTEKKQTDSSLGAKRSYCYPSAYFKIHIPLPEKAITDQFDMRYENDYLFVDLFKELIRRAP